MKKLALIIPATLALPAGALGADGGGPNLAGSLAQMVGSLVLVIGIILILYYLAGRFLKLGRSQGGAGYIRVVETRHLAPKKSLLLVEVGGEYLLLSNSGEAVTFIKQVEMVEEIEVVDEASCAKAAALAAAAGQQCAALIPPRLRKRLEVLAGDIPVLARLGQLKKNGGFA